MIVALLIDGVSIDDAVENMLDYVERVPEYEEVTEAIMQSPFPNPDARPRAVLDGRWVDCCRIPCNGTTRSSLSKVALGSDPIRCKSRRIFLCYCCSCGVTRRERIRRVR